MCHTLDVWLNRFLRTRAIWSKQTGWHENCFNKKVCNCSAPTTEVHIHNILIHTNTSSRSLNFICTIYIKNSNWRKEVGIAIKNNETSSEFKPVRNSYCIDLTLYRTRTREIGHHSPSAPTQSSMSFNGLELGLTLEFKRKPQANQANS